MNEANKDMLEIFGILVIIAIIGQVIVYGFDLLIDYIGKWAILVVLIVLMVFVIKIHRQYTNWRDNK